MSFARKTQPGWLLAAMVIPGPVHKDASACTSIGPVAEDGTLVCGRTMEWGAFDLNSRVAIDCTIH